MVWRAYQILLDIRNFYGLRAKNCKFRIFWKVFSILKFHSKFSLKKSQFPTESFENTFGELSVACKLNAFDKATNLSEARGHFR